MTELTAIKGIGKAIAEKLKSKNITTLEDLAVMNVEELASVLGCSWKVAKEIQGKALSKTIGDLIEVELLKETEKRLKESVRWIPTGSKSLDSLIGGGFRTEAITLIYGRSSTLKTQLANQIIVNTVSDSKDKAVFIATEAKSFSPERIRQIKSTVGTPNYDNILHIPARTIITPQHQYLAYLRVKKLLEEGEPIRTVVIDSFTKTFRGYYQRREQLPERSRELARHFSLLDIIATKYNVGILLTAQVMGTPTSSSEQIQATGAPEQVRYGLKGAVPWGGPLLMHNSTIALAVERVKGSRTGGYVWKAILKTAPDRAEGEAYFTCTEEGIRDYKGQG